MGESEGKWKEAGATESLAPKSLINERDPSLQCSLGIIYCPSYAKLQKYMNWPLLHEGQFKKTKKKYKKKSTRSKRWITIL